MAKDDRPRPNDDDEIASVGDDKKFNDEVTEIGPESKAENQQKINQLEAALESAKKDFLYLRADFDNYKKSVIKERSDLIKYGNERVFVDILNVLDTFERALELEVTPENIASFKEGLNLTAQELKNTLERFGLKVIETQNVPFDPNVHEALSSEETDTVPPGHVCRTFKKAYKLHERVIRPAQVVVAKEPTKNSNSTDGKSDS